MSRTRLALVVGHRKSDKGAHSPKHNLSEWEVNKVLVEMIRVQLDSHIEPIIVYRDDTSSGYKTLPTKINNLKPDHIIEFHCNAVSNTKVMGNEMLYYYRSSKSKAFATMLNNVTFKVLGVKDRGLLPIENSKQNGHHLLKGTAAPCVIYEPAFLSSDEDFGNMLSKLGELASELAKELNKYFK